MSFLSGRKGAGGGGARHWLSAPSALFPLRPFRFALVSVFVDDAKNFPISYWGPRIEKSEYFPRKTNVEFVQVLNDHEVIMRVWERGAAVTLACGTGACATTTACVLNGKTGRDILLHLDGGDLNVRWDEESNHLFMTGPAQEVFQGEYPLGDGSHE